MRVLTVTQLANELCLPVETLIEFSRASGLPTQSAEDRLTDHEKSVLLDYLHRMQSDSGISRKERLHRRQAEAVKSYGEARAKEKRERAHAEALAKEQLEQQARAEALAKERREQQARAEALAKEQREQQARAKAQESSSLKEATLATTTDGGMDATLESLGDLTRLRLYSQALAKSVSGHALTRAFHWTQVFSLSVCILGTVLAGAKSHSNLPMFVLG